jgi:hypothetical protein
MDEYLDLLQSKVFCCLSRDEHLIEHAVLLKCGGHACKACAVATIEQTVVKCNHCSVEYQLNKDFQEPPIDIGKTINLLIHSNFDVIFDNLTKRFGHRQENISM